MGSTGDSARIARRWIARIALIGALTGAPRPGHGGGALRLREPGGAGDVAARSAPVLAGRPALEWAAAALGGAVWFTSAVLVKSRIAPSECRWCESNWFDDDLRSLRWSDRHAADLTSDVLSFAVAPAAAGALVALAAARDGRAEEIWLDSSIVAEALVASALAGEVLKVATARERPFVHDLPPAGKSNTPQPDENNLSFVSSHAATSFALAVASGTVATLRRRRLAPIVWATGLTLAAATSYLRLAADEHYATDVLGGAAIGAAIGLAVPLLHRGGERESDTVIAVPVRMGPGAAGATIVLRWR
ncbi:MAG TPA: phosphatase PAP2 family protein [Candidatus Acidoferrum sp.]|nr:phosphatase PAP2 family protein [Candidatus Acidoferrum sp.]